MTCSDFKISWGRRRREMYYGCKLPNQDNLIAKYLFKKKIQDDGTIIDETGISGDAYLVDNNCFLGNGIAIIDYNFAPVKGQDYLDIEFTTEKDSADSVGFLNNESLKNMLGLFWSEQNEFFFFIGDGISFNYVVTDAFIPTGISTKVRFIYDGNQAASDRIKIYADDILIPVTSVVGAINSTFQGNPTVNYNTGQYSVYMSTAKICNIINRNRLGDALNQYPVAEGGLCPELINTGINSVNADIINFIPLNRKGKTKSYHYNATHDVDVYENGVVGEEIYIPAGKPFAQAGYIQSGTLEYLDENENGGLTGNSQLDWVNGEAINFIKGGAVTKENDGIRIFGDGANASLNSTTVAIETGTTYHYYAKLTKSVSGVIRVRLGSQTGFLSGVGASTGTLTATSTNGLNLLSVDGEDNTISEFYIWKDGTIPSFSPTNPFLNGHNGTESKIQLPASLSAIQDAIRLTSLTNNSGLKWSNGKIINFEINATGAGEILDTAEGTHFFTVADFISIRQSVNFKAGMSYNFYIKVTEYTLGTLYIDSNNVTATGINGVGIFTGIHTQSADYSFLNLKRNGATDLKISEFYMWEEGTVPPLSYREMQTDFNSEHQAIMYLKENDYQNLAIWSAPLNHDDAAKAYKCIGVDKIHEIWNDTEIWDDSEIWID